MRHPTCLGLIGAIALIAAGCTPQTAAKARITSPENSFIETEAKSAIGSLLFDQQTYFLENSRFALSVKQLNGSVVTETKNYRYNLTAKPDRYKGVAVMATSKKSNLRSYTGVVFAVKSGKQKDTFSQICETTQPSNKAPAVPANPKLATDKIKCPAGSHSADEIFAQQQ